MKSKSENSKKPEEKDGGGDAPAFMVYYCSVMILLLAFFIVLQAFAEDSSEEMFYKGQGSFISALDNLGLGVLRSRGSHKPFGELAPGYKHENGSETEPLDDAVDPDRAAAKKAVRELGKDMDVEGMDDVAGYRVEIAVPIEYGPGKKELDDRERRFLRRLAGRLEDVIVARRFIVRIGLAVACSMPEMPLEEVEAAMKLSEMIRREIVASMSDNASETAGKRIYSFLRSREREESAQCDRRRLRVDVLLTKPYAIVEEGAKIR